MENMVKGNFFDRVLEVLKNARKQAKMALNISMVYSYYEVGRMIVEEEQNGKQRAEYGKAILKELSECLTESLGKGFSVENLKLMRRFYMVYSQDQIGQKVSAQFENLPETQEGRKFFLSFSHYVSLMRISNIDERHFYEIEAVRNGWGVKELGRQYDSALYERLALSRDKEGVERLSTEGQIIEKPEDLLKDPYVLEFLGLSPNDDFYESDLEEALITHLQKFLLELGRGFSFVARQKRITFDGRHFRIDLVFYNYILKCFVLIDLKIGDLTHQDLGQMQMYVHYYERELMNEGDNPPIGIVLCADKSESVVKYTLPENETQIFASKYKLYLPSEEELSQELQREYRALEYDKEKSK